MKIVQSYIFTCLLSIGVLTISACATSSGLSQQQMDTVYNYNYQLTLANGQGEKSAKTMANIGLKTFKMSAWANSENKELIDKDIERMQQALDKQKIDKQPLKAIDD